MFVGTFKKILAAHFVFKKAEIPLKGGNHIEVCAL